MLVLLLKVLCIAWHVLLWIQVIPAIFIPYGLMCAGKTSSRTLGWCYFVAVQVVALDAMMIGWFLLIAPCVMRAWIPIEQIYQPEWAVLAGLPKKVIEVWRWQWLNRIWGNDEDGVVSGLRGNVDYNPDATRWRAYLWSAWRNSANNLRFVFKWEGGPFYRWENASHTFYFQAGWYPNGFPVISAGAT